MDRARRLTSLWNWLPVFRAVAELEHLHRAAKVLRVSASAVSRTIRLLEEDLGHPLFVREGRSLALNRDGRALLASVRDAMRLVDDGIAAIETGPRGVSVACAGDHPLFFLARALVRLRAERPGIIARVLNPTITEVSAMLLRGELDIAFGSRVERVGGLHVEAVGTITHGIFCGRSHPLYGRAEVTLADVLAHDFAAPSLDLSHGVTDCWPADIERRVAVYLPALAPAVDLCAQGAALVVLPDGLPAATALYRLPVQVVESVKLYAVRRTGSADTDVAAQVIDLMRTEMNGRD